MFSLSMLKANTDVCIAVGIIGMLLVYGRGARVTG